MTLMARPPLSNEKYTQIVALLQQGKSYRAIAETVGCHPNTVFKISKDPMLTESIAVARQTLKEIHIRRARGMAESAWTLAENAAKAGESRGFKDTMDGIRALEQVASQAAGESQRGDTITPVQVNVNVGEILRQAFGIPTTKALDAGSPDPS